MATIFLSCVEKVKALSAALDLGLPCVAVLCALTCAGA